MPEHFPVKEHYQGPFRWILQKKATVLPQTVLKTPETKDCMLLLDEFFLGSVYWPPDRSPWLLQLESLCLSPALWHICVLSDLEGRTGTDTSPEHRAALRKDAASQYQILPSAKCSVHFLISTVVSDSVFSPSLKCSSLMKNQKAYFESSKDWYPEVPQVIWTKN